MGSCGSKLNVLKKGDAVRLGGAGYVYDPDWKGEPVEIRQRYPSFCAGRAFSDEHKSAIGYYAVKGHDGETIWKLYDEDPLSKKEVIKLSCYADINSPPHELYGNRQQSE